MARTSATTHSKWRHSADAEKTTLSFAVRSGSGWIIRYIGEFPAESAERFHSPPWTHVPRQPRRTYVPAISAAFSEFAEDPTTMRSGHLLSLKAFRPISAWKDGLGSDALSVTLAPSWASTVHSTSPPAPRGKGGCGTWEG